MPKLTDEQLAAIRAANPAAELHLIENDRLDFQAVVKTPTWADWRQFRLLNAQAEQKPASHKHLCATCLVSPTAPEFEALLNKHPGLAELLSVEIQEIAGLIGGTTSRKL